jgi:uncharacterized cupin superfamily protein
VPGAQLEDFGSGLTPVTQGWFVVNVRDAEWWFSERRGARCAFESEYGDPPVEFAQFGINVTVLEPGQTGLYHAESNQEAFLVLSGECALLVEDEERRLRPWDFFHSSPWTEHAFVGAGEGPCVILMVGSRSGTGVHYPVSELAARYGASVAEETSDWRQAYASGSGESGRRTRLVCPGRRFLQAVIREHSPRRLSGTAQATTTRGHRWLVTLRGCCESFVVAHDEPTRARLARTRRPRSSVQRTPCTHV